MQKCTDFGPMKIHINIKYCCTVFTTIMTAIGLICKKKEEKKMFCFYYTIWPWWLSKWPPAESMDLHQYNYFYNATIENTESRCCYNCSQCVYLSLYLSIAAVVLYIFFFHSLSYLQIKHDRCEIKSSFFNLSTLFHHDNSVHLHSAHFCFSAIV